MKKIIMLLAMLFLLTGCTLFKDNLEDAKITTTIYPIEFLLDTLYDEYGTVSSIYPADTDIDSYELTDKQVSEYASSDLFVYNGLSKEKNIAKDLINKNNKLLIIDVSYGLTYTYGLEELWLSPNNYMMLAKNIRDNLSEYLKSRAIIDNISKKYDEFAEKISVMDADLRTIGKEAKENNTNTLIVSKDVYKYLENYGFNVISVENADESTINSLASGYKNGNYKGIIVSDNNLPEAINQIITENNVTTISTSTMINNKTEDDYLTIMQHFIDEIRNLVLAQQKRVK